MQFNREFFSTTNPNEFQSVLLRTTGCDVNVLSAAPHQIANTFRLRTGPVFLSIRSTFESETSLKLDHSREFISVLMIEKGSQSILFDGTRALNHFNPGSLAIFEKHLMQVLHFDAGTSNQYLAISKDTLLQYALRLTGEAKYVSPAPLQLESIEAPDGRLMASLVRNVLHCYSAFDQKIISEFTLRQMEETALLCLLDMMSPPAVRASRDIGSISRNSFKAALDLARSSAEPLTVGELAAAIGVTARALQLSFKKELGISPHAYLRQVRLMAVRHEFEASGQTGLLSIARRWGFSNASRFKSEYIAAFGVQSWPVPESVRATQSHLRSAELDENR